LTSVGTYLSNKENELIQDKRVSPGIRALYAASYLEHAGFAKAFVDRAFQAAFRDPDLSDLIVEWRFTSEPEKSRILRHIKAIVGEG
jgi:hypothetical protein